MMTDIHQRQTLAPMRLPTDERFATLPAGNLARHATARALPSASVYSTARPAQYLKRTKIFIYIDVDAWAYFREKNRRLHTVVSTERVSALHSAQFKRLEYTRWMGLICSSSIRHLTQVPERGSNQRPKPRAC